MKHRKKTLAEIDLSRRNEVIAKRKGNKVRWYNRATGEWAPGWWPLFVQVPTTFPVVGLTADEFNTISRSEGWPGR